ncbi:hypothetical protein EIP86_000241 [Pleurotus ostreatoroseus]|nr:hypothetical protein EIP86_000241 [Pleurotus ostreatoroseus]
MDEETVDGCPIMHITDQPSAFEIFLKLIYDGFQYRDDQKKPEWEVVKVMLLLGDKYDVDEFRTEGIMRLKLRFPEDISVWDKREGIAKSQSGINQSVASITRKLDLPELHAAVLYSCCVYSVRALIGLSTSVTGRPSTVP